MNANVVVSAWTLILLIPAALLLGFGICAAFVIAGERFQRRWIKRAVPILREYHEVLTRQHETPSNYVGDCRISDVERLLEEVKERKGQEN